MTQLRQRDRRASGARGQFQDALPPPCGNCPMKNGTSSSSIFELAYSAS